ncbi:DUF3127 domain-containing protein [Flammeovirga yaeyamensis]|uniref:DUF3127 domain-containing protein n=1 Tax=Flammeovirga yaeyamensis TaxID=367791 RepID=A0AAX1N3B5_9BACT|nr:DUF3127 domain-containing protein [Flammeovirga yaeyamensis]MBB3696074.1 hypothetical protein [Flammeovirga yaeyamensis]NMF34759.1 DUF3127 domain-containing protein [Flammeovirga yaeyamensis]QWG00413.1 DUF3127 domain-containing protein [Flammeovirga yaeyamensis]
MAFDVVGKIEKLFETQQVSDKFKKREFILLIQDGQYPQYIKFQATQDRCNLLDSFNEGDDIAVTFDLRGRPYDKGGETIYFTNLEAWRIQQAAAYQPQAQAPQYGAAPSTPAPTPAAPTSTPAPTTPTENIASSGDDVTDDLPF